MKSLGAGPVLLALAFLGACRTPAQKPAAPSGSGERLPERDGGPLPAAEPDDGLGWARGRVWYQIFPERFRNGDPSNDPTAAEVPEADGREWHLSPWTGDWYELQPWELKRSTDFYHAGVVFARRYGGDIAGMLEKLDYLKDLGVDVIYLNPVFAAPSLHKYDSSSLHHVDPNFGPDPAGDRKLLAEWLETEAPATWIWTKADVMFLRLIHEAHRRGIKVVIDGVFNHTGRSFFAFQDVLKNGRKSRYAGWYAVTRWGEKPGEEFDYKAWWGIKSLPVFARDAQGLAPGPKKYVSDITRRWLAPHGNPANGVDGFRLDVIEEIPAPFWKEWHSLVKASKPEAVTVAEIWGDAAPWVKDGRVDSTMNYQFAQAAARFFIDRRTAISGRAFAARLRRLLASYAPQKAQILLNLVDSHDTDRVASMILNPDRDYNRKAGPRDNPGYDVGGPGAAARRIQMQIAAFQIVFAGAPMVYYGDEAGMWGAQDPDDRKPMVWPDLDFAPEQRRPFGPDRPAAPVRFDRELWAFYRGLLRLRHENPALLSGDLRFLDGAVSRDLVGFARRQGGQEALALFNRSDRPRTVDLPAKTLSHARYRDALGGGPGAVVPGGQPFSAPGRGGGTYTVAKGRLSIAVPPRWFVILLCEPGT